MSVPPALPDGLLLECLVTTVDAQGHVHVAPMGPIVDTQFRNALLRPYPPSVTLDNLKANRGAVLHITDDAAQIAYRAIGLGDAAPATRPTPDGRGAILLDACRWSQVEVVSLDESVTPHHVHCRVTDQGRLREFVGFNRAKHAVIEAAILATRLDYLPHADVRRQLQALAAPVEKTGGQAERDAYACVSQFVLARTGAAS